jgi:hypothetical protein
MVTCQVNEAVVFRPAYDVIKMIRFNQTYESKQVFLLKIDR